MKRKKLGLLIICLALLGFLIFIGNSIVVTGVSDVSYSFQKDTIYDNTPEYNQSWNIIEQAQYTQDYRGTFSFEDDTIGENPTGLTCTSGVIVISELENHNKVVMFNDTSSSSEDLYHFIETPIAYGTIDLWFYLEQTNKIIWLSWYDISNENSIFLTFYSDGYFKYYDTGYHSIISYEANLWYHLSIDFDVGNTGYKGLSDDTFYISVNGVRYGSYNIRGSLTQIDTLRIQTHGSESLVGYLDALGYSYDSFYEYSSNYHFNEFSINEIFSYREPYNLWYYVPDTNCFAQIKNDSGIEEEYLSLINNNYNAYVSLYDIFEKSYTSQIFSLYVRMSNTQGLLHIIFKSSTNVTGAYIMFGSTGYIWARESGGNTQIQTYSQDIWYKLTLDYDVSTDTYDFYINNVYIDNYDFYQTTTDIDKVLFQTGDETPNYCADLDLITNDYDGLYSENFLPIPEVTGYYGSDKYDFLIKEPNVLFDNGDDNPADLVDKEYPSGDYSNLDGSGNYYFECDYIAPVGVRGFERTYLGYECDIIELYYNFTVTARTSDFWHILIKIDSLTDTKLIMYFNHSDFYYEEEENDIFTTIPLSVSEPLTVNDYFEFYFIIYYDLEICIFSYYKNGIYIETFNIPLCYLSWYNNERGFNSHYFWVYNYDTSTSVDVKLHSLRIMYDGLHHSGECGFITYPLEITWDYQTQNLLNSNFNGYFGMGSVVGDYVLEETYYEIRDFKNYTNYDYINAYEGYANPISDVTLIFFIINNFTFLEDLEIYGVQLIEGLNEYPLVYTFSNIDSDYSLFYISSNRLYWRYYADDTNLEYIKALFDIQDLSSTNRSIAFHSDNSGDGLSYCYVNFVESSNELLIPKHRTYNNQFLTQARTIQSIHFIITDSDNNEILGYSSGYIVNLKLMHVYNIPISVLTQNLITAIIPIMVILIPTLALGELASRKAIIPLFLLLSIVCYIGELIPLWLLFVIIISNSLSLFWKEEESI